MTHNPKSPWPRRTQPAPQTQSARDVFAERLRQLGAPADLVEQTLASWNDPEWQDRDEIVGLSDVALAAEIAAIVREHHEGTHTEEEDELARHRVLVAQATEVIQGVIHDVMEWVNEHPGKAKARAAAAAEAESEQERPRSTLLELLERVTSE